MYRMSVEGDFIKPDQAEEAPRLVSAMLLELVDGLPADRFVLDPRRRRISRIGQGRLAPSLRRLVRDQVVLHDELQCTIAFQIHGVSLLALDGRENGDNRTAVLINDVADSKFGH
jgi:hypothetical protein